MTPCFKARIGLGRAGLGQSTKSLESLLLGQGTEALDDFAMRAGWGECEDLRDLRMPVHPGRDLSSVSKCRQL